MIVAIYTLLNCGIYVGEYDYSSAHAGLNVQSTAAAVDVTRFGATTRIYGGGLPALKFSGNGYWDEGDATNDAAMLAQVGTKPSACTILPYGRTVGDPVYLFKPIVASYKPIGDEVGGPLKFNLGGSGVSALIAGKLAYAGTITTPASGTAINLGAIGATQKLYAALHVYADAGSALAVTIESDDNEAFTSAITRVTFTSTDVVTSEWKELAGAITDIWWRANITFTGTSFGLAVSFGIL